MKNYSGKGESIKDCIKYYNSHTEEFYSLIKKYDKETLCRVYFDLNSHEWDENILGKFKGYIFATALFFAIQRSVGKYELDKYWHLVVHKDDTSGKFCKTEEEYDRYCFIELVNENGRRGNPIYNPLFW